MSLLVAMIVLAELICAVVTADHALTQLTESVLRQKAKRAAV
jgi:hypothetical protein